MPKIGDKVTFHYGRVGEVSPYPAVVIEVLPIVKMSIADKTFALPQALVLDVDLPDEILAAGINPRQSHAEQTDPGSPLSGGWS